MPNSIKKDGRVIEIVQIDKELDDEFRAVIMKTKGLHKGVLRDSFHEALKLWIKEQKKRQK